MRNIINISLSVLAAAVSLACGNAVAQDDPVSGPDVTLPAEKLQTPRSEEPWQPNSERVPARPEQVEEAIDEVLDPELDPSTPEDDKTDPLDTDRISTGPPTDDRMVGERIDSTLQDEVIPDDGDGLVHEEPVEDR